MGLSCAVVIANTFMHWIERNLVLDFLNRNKLLFFRRLQDDIFSVFESKEDSSEFFRIYNTLHPNITLIPENHNGNSVDFLDLTIFKGVRFQNSNRLDLKMFQKFEHVNGFLPYVSNHPTPTKRGVIKGELIRAIRNNSSEALFKVYLNKHFIPKLKSAGYTESFWKPILSETRYSRRSDILGGTQRNNRPPGPILKLRHSPTFNKTNLNSILKTGWRDAVRRSGLHAALAYEHLREPMIARKRNLNASNLLMKNILPK